MGQIPGPANFIGLTLLGGVLLWTVQIVYGRRGTLSSDGLLLFMTIVAWVMILVGMLGSLAVTSSAGIVPILVVLVILAMVVVKFRDGERRSLLWVLSVSAERGLPLAPAARAYSAERMDEQGRRARRLAELLEAGTPLPDALKQSKNRLPIDAILAIRVGEATNDMGQLLRDAVREGGRFTQVWQPLFERAFYLFLIAFTMAIVIPYLLMFIVPTFVEIFDDFQVPSPPVTKLVIEASKVFSKFAMLFLPLYAAAFLVFGASVFYYVGWIRWEPPFVGRLTRRFDSANVMRVLSHAIARDRSLIDTLGLLSTCYPKWHVRSRLSAALRRIDEGADWCISLQAVGLFTSSDAAVLRAAERVGNLPWALREMADNSLRRLSFRISALQQIAFPVIIGLFAIPVLVISIACIQPLVHLIEMMSHV